MQVVSMIHQDTVDERTLTVVSAPQHRMFGVRKSRSKKIDANQSHFTSWISNWPHHMRLNVFGFSRASISSAYTLPVLQIWRTLPIQQVHQTLWIDSNSTINKCTEFRRSIHFFFRIRIENLLLFSVRMDMNSGPMDYVYVICILYTVWSSRPFERIYGYFKSRIHETNITEFSIEGQTILFIFSNWTWLYMLKLRWDLSYQYVATANFLLRPANYMYTLPVQHTWCKLPITQVHHPLSTTVERMNKTRR